MKSLWFRLPLTLKFAVPAALMTLLAGLLMIAATQWAQRQLLHSHLDGIARALTARLAAGAARPLIDNDPVRLQAVVGEFASESVVQRAAVFDLENRLAGAAGDEDGSATDYTAEVVWQGTPVGRAVLSLRSDAGRSRGNLTDLRLQDLLTLAGVLAVAAGVFGLWFGRRFEAQLILLMRKLSGETVPLAYPDTDTLGHLLHHPVPPLLPAEPAPPARNGATLLQVYCPSEVTVDCERMQAQAEAVAQLYGGTTAITRAGGMTIRFPNSEDEMEGPFRALCGAHLLQRLSAPHALRLALMPLASADDGLPWREQQITRQLNQACVDIAADNEIAIDAQLQRHPVIQERCALEAREEFWIVNALRAPYDTLLERQFATLKDSTTSQPDTL